MWVAINPFVYYLGLSLHYLLKNPRRQTGVPILAGLSSSSFTFMDPYQYPESKKNNQKKTRDFSRVNV